MKITNLLSILTLVLGVGVYCGSKDSQKAEDGAQMEESAENMDENSDDNEASGENKDMAMAESDSSGDVDAAKVLAACTSCHYLDKGAGNVKNGMGPGLKGVYNRKPSSKGIPYEKWTEENLDTWLLNPRGVFARSRMSYRVPDNAKRAEVIKALKTL